MEGHLIKFQKERGVVENFENSRAENKNLKKIEGKNDFFFKGAKFKTHFT